MKQLFVFLFLSFFYSFNIFSQEIILSDITQSQNVSGDFPDHVLIRTMTQSYCKYYEFIIKDGLVYSKKAGDKKWELFLGKGLPFFNSGNMADKFETPSMVCELCCDADSLYVFDEQGIMYSIFIAKGAPEKILLWRRLSGFPKVNYVVQDALVCDKRAWSMGARREDILWYEDIYGNQHHWGTMGLETIYFLTNDGQHIRFTDSGVPADFSHSVQCPEEGRFISENISVSGDTLFLIGDSGTMYTRLIDFDTMGCDPMFFQYTYENLRQSSRGTDYISNYSPWALPAEDWKKEPSIVLEGKARLTKMISIAQTGRGNYARELRVAGLDKDGETGYYHKMLSQRKWFFTKAPLNLKEEHFLTYKNEIGDKTTYDYYGYITKNGAKLSGYKCSITGAALSSEDRCVFTIEKGNEKFTCKMYPVEKWTFTKRYAPGFDGTPKYYFVTPEFDDVNFSSYSKDFCDLLSDIFLGRSHELFVFSSQSTDRYYEISIEGRGSTVLTNGRIDNTYDIFMTKDGMPLNSSIIKGADSLRQTVTENVMDKKLLLEEKAVYTMDDKGRIQAVLAENIAMKQRLEEIIKNNNSGKRIAKTSRWGFSLVELITKITFLRKINFPKIKQMTSFGSDLMITNESMFTNLCMYTEWTYPSMIELLELRILYYGKLLKDLDSGQETAQLRSDFSNSFSGYYKNIGLPEHIGGEEGVLDFFSSAFDVNESIFFSYPWFLLQKNDGTRILVRLKDSARSILDSKGVYNLKASFTLVSVPEKEKPAYPTKEGVMDEYNDYEGNLYWDGKEVRIYIKNAMLTKKCIFSCKL